MIRPYEPRDAEAAFCLAKESPEAAQWTLLSYRQLGQAGELVWVAERNGGLAAFLVARTLGEEAEILNIVVDKSERRAAMGRNLLAAALTEFVRVGVRRVFLEVRQSNEVALRFYETQGFIRNGSRKGYYREPAEDAVLMERKLTG